MRCSSRWIHKWPLHEWVGGVIVGAVLVCALMAPLIAPFAADYVNPAASLLGPSVEHPLGTDEQGADLLSLVIYGARGAVLIGFGTVLLSGLIGLLAGVVSGYYGGKIDEVVMRLVEVFMSFPGILLAIFIVFLTAEPGQWSVIIALSATGWAGYARLIRGQVLEIRERDFVAGAKAVGASDAVIVCRHVLPNLVGPLSVQATFGVAGAILAEASLSFLGLGPQDAPSWGALLDQGAILFVTSPHVALVAGIAIFVTVLGVNLLGDALRDRLDPHVTY